MAPILDEHTLEFVSRSAAQTQRLGAKLGTLLEGGNIICLEGPLGSGKTSLAQGIGRGWGTNRTLVSPTYVLVREYTRSTDDVVLYHVDLYRVSGVHEALGLGIEELLGDPNAVFLIEWAERARAMIPPDHLWIKLDFADTNWRMLRFSGNGARHVSLLHDFRRLAFGA